MYNCSMFNLLFIVDGNEDVFIDKMISLSHVEHKKMFSTKINQRRYNFFMNVIIYKCANFYYVFCLEKLES